MEKNKTILLEEKREKIAHEIVKLLASKDLNAREVFVILDLAKDKTLTYFKLSMSAQLS